MITVDFIYRWIKLVWRLAPFVYMKLCELVLLAWLLKVLGDQMFFDLSSEHKMNPFKAQNLAFSGVIKVKVNQLCLNWKTF